MINSLTSLRFIAAVAIYLHHLNFPGGLGAISVTFFFVISGFTMAIGYNNKFQELKKSEIKNFYFKRFVRIYPLHILTVLLAIPVMLYTDFEINLYNSITNLFMIQSYIPSGIEVFSFNSVSWFIANLIFFYLLTPFFIFLIHKVKIKKSKKINLVLLFCILIVASFIAYHFRGHMEAYSFGWWFIYISPYFRVFDFILGLIAGFLFIEIKKPSVKGIASRILFTIFEIGAIGFLIVSYKSGFLGFDSFKYGLYYIPASILIVFIFAFQKGFVSLIISGKILVYLGNLSFPIFLMHQLVIIYTSILFAPTVYGYTLELTHVISQIALFIVIISLSDSLQRYFEIPIKNKLNKYFKV